MPLSSILPNVRQEGGVDTVCQLLLQGILENDSYNEYFILAFNPTNDTENNDIVQIDSNIRIKFFNAYLNKKNKLTLLIPTFLLQNLIIKKEVYNFCPDILHVHASCWLFFKYSNKIKKILTLHTYQTIGRISEGFCNDFLYERIIQPINIKNADIITTLSRDIEGILGDKLRKEIKYIPNPVNNVFFGVNRNIDKLKKGGTIILMGGVVPKKRVIDGLKLISVLRNNYPEIKLFVAGKCDEKSSYYLLLKKYINENRLEKNVIFTGHLSVPELLEYYSKVNIGLFLSEDETFGLAPLEMMAAGLPVITTNVGIFKWHETEFKHCGAFIIKPGDIIKALQYIQYLLQNSIITRSEEIRRFIIEKFSKDYIFKKYLSLYV